MRESDFDSTIREFRITSSGIVLPAIVLSAGAMQDVEARYEVPRIKKPFDLDILLEQMAAMLSRPE